MPDLPQPLPLLAVPNVSEGRDMATIDAIVAACTAGGGVRLLDRHADADHHRAVLTLAGGSSGAQGGSAVPDAPDGLAGGLLRGIAEAVRLIDVGDGRDRSEVGQHPHVGAVDVAPVVYLDPSMRGAACVVALLLGDLIGAELGVPVFLYGELAAGRTRAELRRGGRAGLAVRMADGELRPDFGPPGMHPTAGATLVAAREPLVAFNLELTVPATIEDARRIAGLIREGGAEGMPGLRAIGVALSAQRRSQSGSGAEQRNHNPRVGGPDGDRVAQVSMNVERPLELPLRRVLDAVRGHADVAAAELVGLAPRAALEGFPTEEVPLRGFDPARQVIENALGL